MEIKMAPEGPSERAAPQSPRLKKLCEKNNAAPAIPLITLKEILAGQQVIIMKDEGCNKNLISNDFIRRDRHRLQIAETKNFMGNSFKNSAETASEVAIDT